jgi:hypothetical protein
MQFPMMLHNGLEDGTWQQQSLAKQILSPRCNLCICAYGQMTSNGRFIVADAIHMRKPAHIVREAIRNIASQDKANYKRVTTIIPQDPGQAGKDQVQSLD